MHFLQIEEEELIKNFESFKLLINLYILNPDSIQKYVAEHLMHIHDKEVIIAYLYKRADFKSAKIDEIIDNLY